MLLVVDELAELAGLDPDALIQAISSGETKDVIRNGRNAAQIRIALLGSLARLARFCGITIVAATQYPSHEVVDQQIRTQMSVRIMLRVTSGEQVDVCLGRGYGKRIGVRSIPANQPGGLWMAGHPDHPEPRQRPSPLPHRRPHHRTAADYRPLCAWPHELVFGARSGSSYPKPHRKTPAMTTDFEQLRANAPFPGDLLCELLAAEGYWWRLGPDPTDPFITRGPWVEAITFAHHDRTAAKSRERSYACRCRSLCCTKSTCTPASPNSTTTKSSCSSTPPPDGPNSTSPVTIDGSLATRTPPHLREPRMTTNTATATTEVEARGHRSAG